MGWVMVSGWVPGLCVREREVSAALSWGDGKSQKPLCFASFWQKCEGLCHFGFAGSSPFCLSSLVLLICPSSLRVSQFLPPSTTDSSQAQSWSQRPKQAVPGRRSSGKRWVGWGERAAHGGGPEVITKSPPWQRFLINPKSKQGHIPKNTIFRSIKCFQTPKIWG